MSIFDPVLDLFKPKNVKSVATMVETWKDSKPTYSETNFSTLVRFGFRKNELIYACITAKADTAAQVSMDVLSKQGKALTEHPLRTLLQAPNPFMSEFDFWYSVIVFLHLAGRACYEKERNRRGEVVRLWPLRPDWLTPVPSSQEYLAEYLYEVPGRPVLHIPASDVLEYKLFDPINQYHPWPPVAVASRVGDIDNAATDFIKVFWEKGATPPAILKTTQKLSDAQVDSLRERWRKRYGGSEHWAEPAILDKDADYKQIGLSFSTMGFSELDARNEARICAIMKVPPIIVGAKVGLDRSTYTNYGEARRAWWEDTLIPLYQSLLDVVQNQLASEFGEVIVKWNFSGVIALLEEQQLRWSRALSALKGGGITLNEYREQIGFDAIGPEGDVFREITSTVEESPMMPETFSKKSSSHPNIDERVAMEKELEKALTKLLKQEQQRLIEEL